jgi:hypothetical protein
MGLNRRITGVLVRPRATLGAIVRAPAWLATWSVILVIWAVLGGWLLSTDVGRQALVDERVRVMESFGGRMSDAEYATLLANPPWWIYFTSGGRVLLTPITTIVVAAVILAVARSEGTGATPAQALAVAVHASVPLLIGQIVAAPAHYVRESLTSPLTLASVLPMMEQGTWPARFFGTMDLFALWWAALVAIGLAALTGRPVKRYARPLAALVVGFAAVAAAVFAVMGGA